MKGKNSSQGTLFAFVDLDAMIPQDHLLRRIERHVNFDFIDDRLAPLYKEGGRPSIDPQVLVRMMLVGYLFGITSERRLCKEVHLNLAYRWFCCLGLEGKVPHHSSFSKNRHGRFEGEGLFRSLFYEVVDQAMEKGLVSGSRLSVDATLVRADAAMASLQPVVVEYSKERYAETLAEGEDRQEASEPRLSTNQTHRSKSDPDSRVATRWGGKRKLSHSHNALMDNASGIVVEAESSDPSLRQEGLSCVMMTSRFLERTGSQVQSVGGDSAYAKGEILGRMRKLGVEVHAPKPKDAPKPNPELFGRGEFSRVQGEDALLCPAGKRLRRVKDKAKPRMAKYLAGAKDCRDCPLKGSCTKAAARTVSIHLDQAAIDAAASVRGSQAYVRSQKDRKRIEGLFGEGKEQMGLSRARLRGRGGMDEQSLMTSLAQNLKTIARLCERGPLPLAAQAAGNAADCALYRCFGSFLRRKRAALTARIPTPRPAKARHSRV